MAVTNGSLKFKCAFIESKKDRSTTVLGPLETQIMHIVWEMHQATASDVHHELQLSRQREKKDIAYTTVMTTMSRLFSKNILTRRKVGMSFVYSPALDQTEFVNVVINGVMDSLVGEFGEPVFRYFADYVARNDQLRQELHRVLVTPPVAEPASVGG
jgi:predicted transcriptional regulator